MVFVMCDLRLLSAAICIRSVLKNGVVNSDVVVCVLSWNSLDLSDSDMEIG